MNEILLAAMIAWAPPTSDDDLPRYASIADDIAAVALDPSETSAFRGDDGRMRTALLLASIAAEESGGFRADVDDGRVRGHLGEVCVMQVLIPKGRTYEGWSAEDLAHDRRTCVRAALHRVRDSLARCRALQGGDKLGEYTHGHCVVDNRIGRRRWRRAFRFAIHAVARGDG